MSELTRSELERRATEAKARYQETIEYVTEAHVEAAGRSGEKKLRRLEKAIPRALNALWSDVKLLVSMLRDYSTGAYRDVPFGTIAAATICLVSPIDAIPDFIPINIAYFDDAAVIALCIGMLHTDIKEYPDWKDCQTISCPPLYRDQPT